MFRTEELLEWMEYIEDSRQEKKVRHELKDILVIVLFASLANADDWVEIGRFAQCHEDYLRKYIGLKNGVPYNPEMVSKYFKAHGIWRKKLSMRKKWFIISLKPIQLLWLVIHSCVRREKIKIKLDKSSPFCYHNIVAKDSRCLVRKSCRGTPIEYFLRIFLSCGRKIFLFFGGENYAQRKGS